LKEKPLKKKKKGEDTQGKRYVDGLRERTLVIKEKELTYYQ
jgi:hypothetical protein